MFRVFFGELELAESPTSLHSTLERLQGASEAQPRGRPTRGEDSPVAPACAPDRAVVSGRALTPGLAVRVGSLGG